jgi:hypothetical protein
MLSSVTKRSLPVSTCLKGYTQNLWSVVCVGVTARKRCLRLKWSTWDSTERHIGSIKEKTSLWRNKAATFHKHSHLLYDARYSCYKMASDCVNGKFMMNCGFLSRDDITRVFQCVHHKSLSSLLPMRKQCFAGLCKIWSHRSSCATSTCNGTSINQLTN